MKSVRRERKLIVLLNFFVVICAVLNGTLPAIAFTDAEFEALVIERNVELRVLSERRKALSNSVEEAELLYGWQLFAGLSKRWDQKPRVDPSFTYDSLNILGSQVGLQKLFSWGLETKFSVDATQTEIVGGRAGTNTFDFKVWETAPSVEVKLPLLAGGFGSKVRADYEGLVAQKKIATLNAESEYDRKMNEARTILWSTILQRKSLENQRETLGRIQKIYQIVQGKMSQNLEASSNFLQTRSALEQAELDLLNAKLRFDQFERLLKLVLNQATMNATQLVIPDYDFTKFRTVNLSDFENKVTAEERIASLSELASKQQAISKFEESGAKLDLVASYTANGQNERIQESFDQSRRSRYPTSFLGLQFSMPLESGINSRLMQRQSDLAKLATERQKYLQTEQRAVQKEDLVSQHNQLVSLLALNLRLEKTQGEKLTNERKMLNQGRSSIYQVLQFELDLARAQSGKYAIALELEKTQQQLNLNKYNNYE